ncbi:hypothetical protein AL532_12085 [Pseudomonas monteilii]|uniref:hypothetical protein n=1 Tax=Pseudomonas TaxID=286 RepID=UPI000CEB7EE2|nr:MULTISPECIES: hypothetical protein [Pseudomonas]AVH37007.1 hypothetical protein AL532_12085 [Pseudomonas monteilii]MDD2075011.1 hypothetical protein [Pseudomonas putida]HDS1693331.1 hypothetical protein [Pseudomonas putida]
MRDQFEASRPEHLLARLNEGYLDASTNLEWTIWQRAWQAALEHKSSMLAEHSPKRGLTADEFEFIRQLFDVSEAQGHAKLL